MNKYNIRATRNELDGYIRHSAWKKFRSRLQGLDLDLRKAVIEYRPTTNHRSGKKRYSATLLHALCDCVNSTPPVPVDLLECLLQACPHLLTASSSTRSPLAVALDRQASPAILECLLMHDTSCESLYLVDNKTGNTPLLQAVKQEANDEIILLLVRYDLSKKSLLIPSKKRDRVPLFYVADQELQYMDEQLPGEFEWMLLQTFKALQIGRGEIAADERTNTLVVTSNQDPFEELFAMDAGDTDWNDESFDDMFHGEGSEAEYFASLLRAVFECAHLLGEKHSLFLVSFLLNRIPDLGSAIDSDGNTMLHYLCKAAHCFSQSSMLEGRLMTDRLVDLAMDNLTKANTHGNLPLHQALETQKSYNEVIMPLLNAAPGSVSTANSVTGRLPLHVVLLNYPSCSQEMMKIWKHFPEAAAVEDPVTHFYPFQLAAISDKHVCNVHPMKRNSESAYSKERTRSCCKNHHHREDLDQLSEIFFLLRAAPQVLRAYLSSSVR